MTAPHRLKPPERLTECAMRYVAWRSDHSLERELDGDRGQEGRRRRWRVGLRTGNRRVAGQAWRERGRAGPAAVEGQGSRRCDRRHVPRGGRHRLRRHREGVAAGDRRPRRTAHRRDHRRRRHCRAHGQQDGSAQPGLFPRVRRPQPHRHLQHQPAGRLADEQERAARTRSAASSSTRHRSPRSRDRSGRWPTPRPRPRSQACA